LAKRGDRIRAVPAAERTAIFRFLEVVVLPFLWLVTRIRREGTENLPRSGAFVLAPNHTSNLDPLVVGAGVYLAGRSPHFLGKASLWKLPVVGAVLRASRQIPVYRGGATRDNNPLRAATEAAERGSGIIVYPEGTLTRDPAIWPMRGKTGAVRIALGSGIPLIPMAHWGTERVLPPYAKFLRPLPRKTITVRFGEPLDLSRFEGKPLDGKTINEATEALMAAITALVEDLRGEKAPVKRWDPAEHNQSEFGHP
jgi:1-acyl-sn-glycerol-3-phosphate acyltransferase